MSAAQKKTPEYFRDMLQARRAGKKPEAAQTPAPAPKTAEVIQIQPDAQGAPITAAAQLAEVKQAADKDRPDAAARQAEAMRTIGDMLDPFEDLHGGFYVLLRVGDRLEAVPLNSQLVEDRIRNIALEQTGRMIGKDAIETVRSMCRTVARSSPKRPVFLRVGKDGDDCLIDLGDETGQIVRATASGWTAEKNEHFAFKRPAGFGRLPTPTRFDSAAAAWAALAPLRENIPDTDHVPLIAALVEYYRPDTPYPVLEYIGAEGSGKTTAAQGYIWASDPPEGNQTPSTRFDVKDIIAASQSRHVILHDNVQPPAPSGVEDVLCPRSTGGAISQRALYSDATAVTNNIHGGTVVTAITPPFRQADMLDRCLIIHVQKPKRYRSTAETLNDYREALPDVLGGALFFLCESLKRRGEIAAQRAFKHRLVDWAMTGEAIMQALGHAPGAFVELLDVKRQRAAEDYIEGDTFARSLVQTLHKWGADAKPADKLPGWRQWATTPGWCAVELHGRLIVAATAQAVCQGISRHCDDWTSRGTTLPTTARATTGALQRVQGVLGRAGIEATLRPINGGKNNAWVFLLPAHGGSEK